MYTLSLVKSRAFKGESERLLRRLLSLTFPQVALKRLTGGFMRCA